jgi:DNA-3-methyladenine glycosylase
MGLASQIDTVNLQILPRSFYDRDVVEVARELLGKRLVRVSDDGLTSGRIVEVEAYLAADDPACHAFRGRTRKNATMFGPPGHAYVYSIHARYCLNVVTDSIEVPCAVLIRAVEPIEGLPLMQQRRGREKLFDLARGPARLCEAMAIDRQLDGCDLTFGQRLWIAEDHLYDRQAAEIRTSVRIGVTSAHDLPLRFFLSGSPFVSGPRRLR